MSQSTLFKYRHYQAEIILLCVRWYLRYSLSYRDLEELMVERALSVDHTTIYRWVQHFAPILEKRCRAKLKQTNDSWRVDETYVRVKGEWMYLYRAVDSAGDTVEFMLSPTRDAVSAKRFFRKALRAPHTVAPRVINVDKHSAYPKAVGKLKKKGTLPPDCELRPIKYLNNLIEQDHRFIKRRVKPGMGFWSFDTAWRTLQGYEATNQLRKGQVQGTTKGDIRSQIRFVSAAFGLVA
jgi:transposase-like protein